jgi:hypothetical protein
MEFPLLRGEGFTATGHSRSATGEWPVGTDGPAPKCSEYYSSKNYWIFGLFLSSGILENTTFLKLDLFPSSDVFLPHLHLRTETGPVFETSCSLEYQMMEKVQKPSNFVCYTSSSEPFRIYYSSSCDVHVRYLVAYQTTISQTITPSGRLISE